MQIWSVHRYIWTVRISVLSDEFWCWYCC